MPAALLLIDIQQDFLDLAGLDPHPASICANAARLLTRFRDAKLPVVHVWTTVRQSSDRMPHWQKANVQRCIHGTPGHQTPEPIRPEVNELVVHKQWFSAFTNVELSQQLKSSRVNTVVLAGVLLRACIRTTAIDAYQHGFSVVIAEDAAGDDDPTHASITRQYLSSRFVSYLTSEAICQQLTSSTNQIAYATPRCGTRVPSAIIDGVESQSDNTDVRSRISPRDGLSELFCLSMADRTTIEHALASGRKVLDEWRRTSMDVRRRIVAQFADVLEADSESIAHQISRDVGKPLRDSKAEIKFAVDLIHAAVSASNASDLSIEGQAGRHDRWRAVRRPHGTVAVITPWNNPLAIPVGKIVPALLYGNVVVWKPALAGAGVAAWAMNAISRSGWPSGLVSLVNGDRSTAEQLISHSAISAATLTGSIPAGNSAAVIALTRSIPFQAELGGNNAAIVWSDTDLRQAAELIAAGGFGSAGQRCTATRRVIIDQRCFDEFFELLVAAVSRMEWGDPLKNQTQIGPVVSAQALSRLEQVVERFVDAGGRVVRPLGQPQIDANCRQGYYFSPTLAVVVDQRDEIAKTETFGPIVAVQSAASWQEAIELCNDVRQGLVASLFSESTERQACFMERASAGILKVNVPTAGVSAAAPFCGWKASAIGPPEHGLGDIDFYTRWQTVYRPS